jgi:hypothetical protein
MFLVRTETVRRLFEAQLPALRGELRLDVGSRRLPCDVRKPIDFDAAQEAVAERFLRLIVSLANDAVMKYSFRGHWETPENIPAVPPGDRLMILTNRIQPTVCVDMRARSQFGLNPHSPDGQFALESLAIDFRTWGTDPQFQREVSDLRLGFDRDAAWVICPNLDAALPDGWPKRSVRTEVNPIPVSH